MTEPLTPATPAGHVAHDPTLIAAFAGRDPGLLGSELDRARALLETCDSCTDLFADLSAIAAAVPTAALPARPRSYTLTAADAARLRPGGWRRFLQTVGSARDGVTLPMALGLTTLGIAGLLVTTIPNLFGAASGAAPQDMTLSAVGAAIPSAAPAGPDVQGAAEYATGAAPSGAAPSVDGEGGVFSGRDDGDTAKASEAARLEANSDTADAPIRDDATGRSVLVVLAGVLLILGLGLFGLRWSARRFGDG